MSISIPHIFALSFAALFVSVVEAPPEDIMSLIDIPLLSPLREYSKKSTSSSSSSLSSRSSVGILWRIGPFPSLAGAGFDTGDDTFVFLELFSIVISLSERFGDGVLGAGVGDGNGDAAFLLLFMVNSDKESPGMVLRDGVETGACGDIDGIGESVEDGKGEFNDANLAFCSSNKLSSPAFLSSCVLTNAPGDTSSTTGWLTVCVVLATESARILAFLSRSCKSSSADLNIGIIVMIIKIHRIKNK